MPAKRLDFHRLRDKWSALFRLRVWLFKKAAQDDVARQAHGIAVTWPSNCQVAHSADTAGLRGNKRENARWNARHGMGPDAGMAAFCESAANVDLGVSRNRP